MTETQANNQYECMLLTFREVRQGASYEEAPGWGFDTTQKRWWGNEWDAPEINRCYWDTLAEAMKELGSQGWFIATNLELTTDPSVILQRRKMTWKDQAVMFEMGILPDHSGRVIIYEGQEDGSRVALADHALSPESTDVLRQTIISTVQGLRVKENHERALAQAMPEQPNQSDQSEQQGQGQNGTA